MLACVFSSLRHTFFDSEIHIAAVGGFEFTAVNLNQPGREQLYIATYTNELNPPESDRFTVVFTKISVRLEVCH